MHEHFGYPKEIIEFDYDKGLPVCLDNAVWDIAQGTILKLGQNKEITHAVKGFEKLTHEQIIQIYGAPPIFKHLKWPDSVLQID